ncbi:MAG: hypothetical protein IPM07_30730 [Anaerolineales bacterium]|nr:hypothetical protein [Anaerolineales bacterium]
MIHTETVHPSQLRRAMASYATQGYPPRYGPHPDQDGMMVVVIVVPDDGAVPDWQVAPPPRPPSWRIDPSTPWLQLGSGLNWPGIARGLALCQSSPSHLAHIA